jgi:erythromycin esterase-like protein
MPLARDGSAEEASRMRAATHNPQSLRFLVQPLTGDASDFDAVIASAADKRYVLIGEATHGTHEFYGIRCEITKRLIADHGFAAVAIEGDWPDAYTVHRYVCGLQGDGEAADALEGFRRFPTWMWRNADVLDFVGWLRSFNETRTARHKAGFFGLDLYSLYASIQAVIGYLERVDPAAAKRAKERYACFDRFGPDTEAYAYSVGAGLEVSCREEVLQQLLDLQRRSFARFEAGSDATEDDRFFAEQNARVVVSAEEYYRTMLQADVSSWNLRDRFMFLTLEHLSTYLARKLEAPAKIVVWAHNSHVGDARATSMGAGRELNIGQLVRRSVPAACRLIGFTTSCGTVTAASEWHGQAERKTVRPPIAGSWEALFQSLEIPNFYLDLHSAPAVYPALQGRMLERAIGVIYRPQTEIFSHYLEARIAEQFDAVFHYDRTRAVEPLERTALWEAGEVPQTYPSGV